MKFEEVLPAFREGKRIRRKNCVWLHKTHRFRVDDTANYLLADDWEIERAPIKYSVETWGNEWHPNDFNLSSDTANRLFGTSRVCNGTKSTLSPIKYRITVEEITE